jgi:predicted P-loop ATPase
MQIAISDNPHYATTWNNTSVTWEGLADHLKRKTVITNETAAEYHALDKAEQGKIKNVGAFMAFALVAGAKSRAAVNIKDAAITILDADAAQPDLLVKLDKSGYSYILYSTHSHTPEKPKYRIIFELSRTITDEHYRHINCRMKEIFGPENFCKCSERKNQEMFYPSSPKDITPIFIQVKGRPVDVDYQLTLPVNWELFPNKDGEIISDYNGFKLGDPRESEGLVGAFNRKYSVAEAIDTFLKDVYTPTPDTNRWQHVNGTSPGLQLVQTGLYAYSWHSTHDVAADGHCHDAFDLVKVHKFGKDFVAMCYWISTALPEIAIEASAAAFKETENATALIRGEWTRMFLRDNEQNIIPCPQNALLAITHDEKLQGIGYNSLKDCIAITDDLPWRAKGDGQWRDTDDVRLDLYLTLEWQCQFKPRDILGGFTTLYQAHAFNPLHDVLNALPTWDGVSRAETVFIDCLGANDNILVRTVTRKWLSACYQRAFHPGIKFDHMLMLIGEQGIHKSRTIRLLGMGFSSDTLVVADMEDGKKASEKIAGIWIMELGELVGMKKADKEALKSYLSTGCDRYRPAYGRYVIERPRLTCFVGTSNQDEQLTDVTGNRRFWIIKCDQFIKEPDNIPQIWAEIKAKYSTEALYLDDNLEALANLNRENFFVIDEWEIKLKDIIATAQPPYEYITRSEALAALMIGSKDMTPAIQTRVSNILRRLYGPSKNIMIKGKQYKRYKIR